MEFLKIDYTTLEIYPKGEKSLFDHDNSDDNDNNSQFVNVAQIILDENPDALNSDLNGFIEVIKKIFKGKAEIFKNYLKENNNDDVLQEFDLYFTDNNNIVKIQEFITKYNIDEIKSKLLAVLFNITTIIDYVRVYVKELEKYNVNIITI
jgi:hypothetical protein